MAVTVVCVVAAGVIVFFAGLFNWFACESGDCIDKTLAQIQLVVGWIAAAALVAAGVLQLWASRPIAIRGFIVAAVLVLGWAVLAQAVAG